MSFVVVWNLARFVAGWLAERTADLSVDLRDALGDRLHLSDAFRRDGVRRSPPIVLTCHSRGLLQ